MLYGNEKNPGSLLKSAALTALMVLVLAGCGGGGGNSGATFPASTGQSPLTPAPLPLPPDIIASSALSANMCVAPRTGIDPYTGQRYPDRPGNLEQEKNWVRAWIDETYLWYDEIPSTIRTFTYASPQSLFADLHTTALTPSGKPRDRFHFIYDTAVWQALSQSGIEAGYGFELSIIKPQVPRELRVAYTEPGTPAARAGIGRGAKIVGVDGIDIVLNPGVEALNAALFPSAAGQSHTFTLQQPDGSVRTVVLVSAAITKVPVQNVRTIDTPTGKVGYLLFNDHIATSEAQLVAAVTQLKAQGVQDLVIDLRYNGGGLLAIASELAFMVAGPQATTGKVFEKLEFNRKNPFQLTDADTVTPFYPRSLGFSGPADQPLPQLGLSRVTVLTGPDTCSASESIINGLRGVNVQVNLIGNATCGKPYGFLPQDNCGTTYFAIQFKGVNNQGVGDYADGIEPTCVAPDDFSHALGDPAEARLAAALSFRATGVCPPVAAAFAKAGVLGSGEPLVSGKSPGRTGRFLRTGALSLR
ncbi:MAG: peptidase S41 [Ramlibacter sp.]|nr:peptidase S41 [Ramlibacter sp.]